MIFFENVYIPFLGKQERNNKIRKNLLTKPFLFDKKLFIWILGSDFNSIDSPDEFWFLILKPHLLEILL